MKQVNAAKLYNELVQAGIPIDGVSSDGKIDFRSETTEEQMALAEQIRAAHDADAKTAEEIALEAAREKADVNRVDEEDIAGAATVEALREQMLKMQAQIGYLLALAERNQK